MEEQGSEQWVDQRAVPADVLDDRQIPRDAIERTRVHEQTAAGEQASYGSCKLGSEEL